MKNHHIYLSNSVVALSLSFSFPLPLSLSLVRSFWSIGYFLSKSDEFTLLTIPFTSTHSTQSSYFGGSFVRSVLFSLALVSYNSSCFGTFDESFWMTELSGPVCAVYTSKNINHEFCYIFVLLLLSMQTSESVLLSVRVCVYMKNIYAFKDENRSVKETETKVKL